MIPKPPNILDYRSGDTLIAGLSKSTILPDIDFETYSPAGFEWCEETKKFKSPKGSSKKGLSAVGVVKYVEHQEAEVLSLAYNLKNGSGAKLWTPELSPPQDLLDYVKNGGLLEAWNSSFEFYVWNYICVNKYNFPELKYEQLRCAMSKSRAYGLPGSLEHAGNVLNIKNKKDKDGKRLLNKFSIPKNPTSKDTRLRILPLEDHEDAQLLYSYNLTDIQAESEISMAVPDLSEKELKFWLIDQKINFRGVKVDVPLIKKCIEIIECAYIKYNRDLSETTDYQVAAASEVSKIIKWLASKSIYTDTLREEDVDSLLSRDDLPDDVRKVLLIRSLISGSAVKKLYAMVNMASSKDRLHDLFIYHSARTGRAAGAGVQPQNFPNKGPSLFKCDRCFKYFKNNQACSWCGHSSSQFADWEKHNVDIIDGALSVIETGNLTCLEHFYGDGLEIISGCLRSLIIADKGKDLICSDYSAIEAVVLAMLAEENWRIEVFKTHGKIYEMSASKITGTPLDEYILYKQSSGSHHPDRKIGKVAELASGYGGWIGAWKNFKADEFMAEEEIKRAILAWRSASPAIVDMWGGQYKNFISCLYGLEGSAIAAVLNPGQEFSYKKISYLTKNDTLYCRLPSGRTINYHKPRLSPSERKIGTLSLSYEGWNTNQKYGSSGWTRMDTYGGKLTENVVQAVSRDILAHAIVNLEKKGYNVVLHVHDEIVAEVDEGFGSIEEFEGIMSDLPEWASGWPVKASGGWRRKRYGK